MSVNFFARECEESPRTNELFGLCDDNNGKKAYSTADNEANWIATVKNKNKLKITFTAIDKCVIKDNELQGKKRCDGMLTSPTHLYFVELETKSKDWITEAINQLKSTIHIFDKTHNSNHYKYKIAFACNKRHPYFHTIKNESMNKFYNENYKFRIHIGAEIVIK